MLAHFSDEKLITVNMKGMVYSIYSCKNKQAIFIVLIYDLFGEFFVNLLGDSSTMTNSMMELSSILRRWTHGQISLSAHLSGIFDASQNILSSMSSGWVKRGNDGKDKEMLLMLAIITPVSPPAREFRNEKIINIKIKPKVTHKMVVNSLAKNIVVIHGIIFEAKYELMIIRHICNIRLFYVWL